jgi:hypothetical protein
VFVLGNAFIPNEVENLLFSRRDAESRSLSSSVFFAALRETKNIISYPESVCFPEDFESNLSRTGRTDETPPYRRDPCH